MSKNNYSGFHLSLEREIPDVYDINSREITDVPVDSLLIQPFGITHAPYGEIDGQWTIGRTVDGDHKTKDLMDRRAAAVDMYVRAGGLCVYDSDMYPVAIDVATGPEQGSKAARTKFSNSINETSTTLGVVGLSIVSANGSRKRHIRNDLARRLTLFGEEGALVPALVDHSVAVPRAIKENSKGLPDGLLLEADGRILHAPHGVITLDESITAIVDSLLRDIEKRDVGIMSSDEIIDILAEQNGWGPLQGTAYRNEHVRLVMERLRAMATGINSGPENEDMGYLKLSSSIRRSITRNETQILRDYDVHRDIDQLLEQRDPSSMVEITVNDRRILAACAQGTLSDLRVSGALGDTILSESDFSKIVDGALARVVHTGVPVSEIRKVFARTKEHDEIADKVRVDGIQGPEPDSDDATGECATSALRALDGVISEQDRAIIKGLMSGQRGTEVLGDGTHRSTAWRTVDVLKKRLVGYQNNGLITDAQRQVLSGPERASVADRFASASARIAFVDYVGVSERTRSMFTLVYLGGYAADRVADIMGVKEETVLKNVRRAMLEMLDNAHNRIVMDKAHARLPEERVVGQLFDDNAAATGPTAASLSGAGSSVTGDSSEPSLTYADSVAV